MYLNLIMCFYFENSRLDKLFNNHIKIGEYPSLSINLNLIHRIVRLEMLI